MEILKFCHDRVRRDRTIHAIHKLYKIRPQCFFDALLFDWHLLRKPESQLAFEQRRQYKSERAAQFMAKRIVGIDSSVFQKLVYICRFSNNIDVWCKLRERGLDDFNAEPVNISLRGKGDHVGI